MPPADYRADDIRQALDALPLQRGDVVFSHSNLGYFGRLENARSGNDYCQAFFDAIFDRIGPNGTFVAPTFTYSFPRKEVFDPQNSSSGMGAFAEWLRKHPDTRRSCDPCYSVAAVGGQAEALTREAPENSFGSDSFFARFYEAGGKIVNFNFDAGSTFTHYVERELRVPYRFDKTFEGRIREGQTEREARSTIWVRYLSDDSLEPAFEGFDKLARGQSLFLTHKLGRGEIGIISAADTYDLIAASLKERPWLLTKAETLGIAAPRIIPE